MIESIKKQGSGWLVNGNMSVPNDPRNTDCQEVLAYIEDGGIVEDEFTPEELAQQAIDTRRAEIYARLKEIDINSVRALRSKSAGRGKQQDDDSLIAFDDEAELLREELAAL